MSGTAAGNILEQSLSVASQVVSKEGATLSQATPSGVVTVVKLSSTSNQVRINRTDGGEVEVLLPAELNNLAKGNLMLVVTVLLPSVGESFPKNKGSDVIQLNSPVVEISFVEESQGEVSVMEVKGLNDSVIIKVSEEAPVEGDECVYFDPLVDAWSSDGAQLVLFEDPGSWCAVSHTSIFAIVQKIPFINALPTELEINSNSYFIAVLLTFALCCFTIPAMCLWLSRPFKAPSTGKAYLTCKGRKARPITFSMTQVVSEKEGGGTDGKVLVKWDVTPDVLPDLDKLKLRHVTTELSTKSREVIRVKSLSDSPVPTPRSRSERSDRSARSESESSFGIDASVPMDFVESGVCNLDDLLPPPEAYRDGERVLYWSQSLQQCASAVIVGRSGTICSHEDGDSWPAYDCRVGRHQQLRCQVPLQLLRPAPHIGEIIVVQIGGKWFPACFIASFFFLEVAQVVLETSASSTLESLEAPEYPESQLQVPFQCIRRRFSKGQLCQIYRSQDGWVSARIEEDKVDEFHVNLVEDADGSSPGEVLVSVAGEASEMLRLPLFLVKTASILAI